MITFLRAHWKLALLGLWLFTLVTALVAPRCLGPAAPAVSAQEVTVATAAADTTVAQVVIEKKARTTHERYRKDGSVLARTVVDETTDSKLDTQNVSVRTEDVKARTEYVERRPSPLAVTGAAEWDQWRLKPRAYLLGADVPIGTVLGVRLRAGAAARWDTSQPDAKTDAVPDAGLITVRVELP